MKFKTIAKFRYLPVLAVLVCLGAAAPGLAEKSQGENWISFKNGVDRLGVLPQGASVELPFKIIWQYKIEEKSNGFVDWGPVAAGGKIYTPDGLNNVLALDANDGKLLWKKPLISNVFTVSLSADTKILYVTTAITTKASPTLFALDPETGSELWNNMINDQPAVGGMEGAPVIVDDRIYAGYLQYEGHGGVAAYDSRTGKLIWNQEVSRMSPYSSLSYGDGRLYAGFENKTLVCLSAADGSLLWSSTPFTDLVYSAPVVNKGRVYAGAGNTLYAFDAARGSVLWKRDVEGSIGHSSFSLHNEVLYVATHDSKIFAVQAKEGGILWSQDIAMGPIESSPLIDAAKKMLYVATQENKIAAVELEKGKVAGHIQLSQDPRGVWKSAPALYNGRLYIGSLDRTFYALE